MGINKTKTLTEEKTVVNKVSILPLKKDENYVEEIENKRKEFLAYYNKAKKTSSIMMWVVVLACLAFVILSTQNNQVCTIISWVLMGVTIVGMIVYYILNKKNQPLDSRNYINDINALLNSAVYGNQNYSEVQTDAKEKWILSDILADKVYEDAGQISSRNVIYGKYKKSSFKTGEVGIYNSQSGKNRKTLFVGRIVRVPNSLKLEGRYLINVIGPNPADLASDTKDLVELVNEDKFKIYGKEGAVFAKDLDKKFIEAIKKINTSGHLINLNVSIVSGNTSLYMSFDDEAMVLPLEHEFKKEANEEYAKDLLDLLEACCLINK